MSQAECETEKEREESGRVHTGNHGKTPGTQATHPTPQAGVPAQRALHTL